MATADAVVEPPAPRVGEIGSPVPKSFGGGPLLVLVALFTVSRVAFYLAGVRYDARLLDGTYITDQWQLLDVSLLHNHLLSSVWHLHSQPPLFNFYCGVLLKLPEGLRAPVEIGCAMLIGLVIVLASYLLLVDLRVPRWLAVAVVVVGIIFDPAFVLYENWLAYAYPTALLAIVACLFLVRYLRSRNRAYGFGFFSAMTAVVLLNSTYQIEWFVLAAAIAVLVGFRRQWRRALIVGAVPAIVVLGLYGKNVAMFGTTTTSSWLGMNLDRVVLFRAPPSEIARLQKSGVLTPLASIPAFAGPERYLPRFAHRPHTGVPALDQLRKADGQPNYNNAIYPAISAQYLHEDLAFIMAHPGAYLSSVDIDARTWFTPTDQNFTPTTNWNVLKPYVRIYDRYLQFQPQIDPDVAVVAFFEHRSPPVATLSYQAILDLALTLIGIPFFAWRRRHDDPAFAGTLAFLWVTVAYAFVVTSLLEIGENERFRFELGPLPLIGATVVAVCLWRAATESRGSG